MLEKIIARAIKLLIAKGLSLITGNLIAQRLLENIVILSQYLMGIGSGGVVANSGEKISLTLAIANHRKQSIKKHNLKTTLCIF